MHTILTLYKGTNMYCFNTLTIIDYTYFIKVKLANVYTSYLYYLLSITILYTQISSIL